MKTPQAFPAFFAIRASLSSRTVEVHVVGGIDVALPEVLSDLEGCLRAGLTSTGARQVDVMPLGNDGHATGLRVSCDDAFYGVLERQVVPYFRTQVAALVRSIHGAAVDVLVSAS
jgi:hypothetical protein